MNLYQQPLNRNTNRRNNRRCSCLKARTKPKARIGTNCNLNAQEQDKQHIELQKQHPDLPEQVPPHEIVLAALNRNNNRYCSYPTARTKPKAGTDTNCNLNAQEQNKQHIELQKQYLDLPEQAPPHEIVLAALRNSRCCSHPRPERNPNQKLQLKCAGTRQATHRIIETTSTNGRASTST